MYLAEPFREIKKVTRKITQPGTGITGIAGISNMVAQLQGSTKEIVEEVAGEWSAKIDESQSLNIQIQKIIQVGDQIGRV